MNGSSTHDFSAPDFASFSPPANPEQFLTPAPAVSTLYPALFVLTLPMTPPLASLFGSQISGYNFVSAYVSRGAGSRSSTGSLGSTNFAQIAQRVRF
ncbi:hypothetical protein FRC09_002634 [Ceratobasidium sp. 395]|nr:hypothetical protein FRC09_002634 [Ceratobasidium sp. 395]